MRKKKWTKTVREQSSWKYSVRPVLGIKMTTHKGYSKRKLLTHGADHRLGTFRPRWSLPDFEIIFTQFLWLFPAKKRKTSDIPRCDSDTLPESSTPTDCDSNQSLLQLHNPQPKRRKKIIKSYFDFVDETLSRVIFVLGTKIGTGWS